MTLQIYEDADLVTVPVTIVTITTDTAKFTWRNPGTSVPEITWTYRYWTEHGRRPLEEKVDAMTAVTNFCQQLFNTFHVKVDSITTTPFQFIGTVVPSQHPLLQGRLMFKQEKPIHAKVVSFRDLPGDVFEYVRAPSDWNFLLKGLEQGVIYEPELWTDLIVVPYGQRKKVPENKKWVAYRRR